MWTTYYKYIDKNVVLLFLEWKINLEHLMHQLPLEMIIATCCEIMNDETRS